MHVVTNDQFNYLSLTIFLFCFSLQVNNLEAHFREKENCIKLLEKQLGKMFIKPNNKIIKKR